MLVYLEEKLFLIHSIKPVTQTASSSDVVLALDWINNWALSQPQGTRVVINLSLAWPAQSYVPTEFQAIKDAIDANLESGILTVVSAGAPKSGEHPARTVDACEWSACDSDASVCVGGNFVILPFYINLLMSYKISHRLSAE